MDSRSSWPVAAAAAAIVALLPAPASATRPPSRPLEPPSQEVVFDDSDPWRPDSDQPAAAHGSNVQATSSADEGAARLQPAARSESWIQVVLRLLRAFVLGGAAR